MSSMNDIRNQNHKAGKIFFQIKNESDCVRRCPQLMLTLQEQTSQRIESRGNICRYIMQDDQRPKAEEMVEAYRNQLELQN